MANEYTYIEKNRIGYICEISKLAELILNDMINEILLFPAGTILIEEINVNKVILHVANGRVCNQGDYPLYENINSITTPTYKLPNYQPEKTFLTPYIIVDYKG